jgi:hypothetical protein
MDEITLRCDCGAHYLDLDIYKDEDSFLVFTARYPDNSWRARLHTIWDILRGQSHLLNEVFLKPGDVDRLRMFLGTNVSYSFTTNNQDTNV